tara:strand:- start:13940 stop:14371 length:432 start_codon:yes stop_codon:yes gene_type:complete
MGRGMNRFLGFQRSVGRFGANYNLFGDIVFSTLFAAIGVACIVMGIKHTSYTGSIQDDCNKGTPSNCPANCEKSKNSQGGNSCVPKEYHAGTGMIILGVIFIALAAVSVWAALYWRRAAYKSNAVATVGGFAFEAQLLNDILN